MNLASCDFARFPKNLANFYFDSIDCTTPSGPDMKYSIFVCFVEMGWFPIQILDNFRFSPIYELSVQIAYQMRIIEEDIYFVKMG